MGCLGAVVAAVLALGDDTTPPVVMCPPSIVVECDGHDGTVIHFSVDAIDDMDPGPVVACDPPSGHAFPLGVTKVFCTATDSSGNQGLCDFTIAVEDTTSPSITCPVDVMVSCGDSIDPVVIGLPDVSDGCDPLPVVQFSDELGASCDPAITVIRTWTATDTSANIAACQQTICILSDCDDADPCTDDYCDPRLGCVHSPDDCDDGDPCTVDAFDAEAGVCVNAPTACNLMTPLVPVEIAGAGTAIVSGNLDPLLPASDCCYASGGIGCDDAECVAIVCAIDAFCCDVGWDQFCADMAGAECAACGGGVAGSNVTEDVIVVLPDQDAIQVILNIDGTFVPQTPIAVGEQPTDIALGLFDGGPYLDIAVVFAGEDHVQLLLNDGMAGFVLDAQVPLTADPSSAPRSVAAAGLNGSGRDDLAVASAGLDIVEVFFNNSPEPAFTLEHTIALPGAEPWSIDPEDIDDDGCPDLLVAGMSDDTLWVLFNQGPPGFGYVSMALAAQAGPVDATAGDYNCDGLTDVASVNFEDGSVSVFLQQDGTVAGQPVFGNSIDVDVGCQGLAVATADVDGDGGPDLGVVAAFQVQIVLNPQCAATFELPIQQGTKGGSPLDIDVLYINGDGVIDLVTVNESTLPSGGSVVGLISDPHCVGDINYDDAVDVDDLVGTILCFGTSGLSCAEGVINADSYTEGKSDGIVDVDDLIIGVILNWNASCD